jgi:mRNA-degrading endonuclease RelE of RelBE toxin-antitoxin system
MRNERRRVLAAAQVSEFIRTLAPETRRRVRLALRGLELDRGDVKALEGTLLGYHRLRVGAVRIIFRYQPSAAGRPQVLCVFAEHRSMVYLLLEGLLARGLAQADQRKETPP